MKWFVCSIFRSVSWRNLFLRTHKTLNIQILKASSGWEQLSSFQTSSERFGADAKESTSQLSARSGFDSFRCLSRISGFLVPDWWSWPSEPTRGRSWQLRSASTEVSRPVTASAGGEGWEKGGGWWLEELAKCLQLKSKLHSRTSCKTSGGLHRIQQPATYLWLEGNRDTCRPEISTLHFFYCSPTDLALHSYNTARLMMDSF